MTDEYYSDRAALAAAVAALPGTLPSAEAIQMLKDLNDLLTDTVTNAHGVDTNVEATKAAYDKAYPDNSAGLSKDMEKKVIGIQAAGKGKHRSRMQLVADLVEDGGDAGDANNKKFVKALRDAFGRGVSGHHTDTAALASTATLAGEAVQKFCDRLKRDGPTSGTFLLASALDVLLPIANAHGLYPEHYRTLRALRQAIRDAGGGGEGSSFWPSGYVSSSSSSGSGG